MWQAFGMTAQPLAALPHAPGRVPILGDIGSVDRKRPTQREADLVPRVGPIYQRELLGERLVIVGGAAVANQCLDETSWARALVGPFAELRAVAHRGLFTARSSDPLWGQARRILGPGFHKEALSRYHASMAASVEQLVANWADEPVVEVESQMTALTLEVIGEAGFSESFGMLTTPKPEALATVSALKDVLGWASESTNDVPVIGHVRRALRGPSVRRSMATLRSHVDHLVQQRVSMPGDVNNDLLALMLNTADPETGEKLPLDNVADQVLTFLVAGHETTASLLASAVLELARSPEDQERIRASLPLHPTFNYDEVAGAGYVRQVLNETLRLHPPAPGFFRRARTDTVLDGYEIPSGRIVFVLSLAAQRDKDAWGEDAAVFRPERFARESLRRFPDRFFAPWGTGPRNCIGMPFALQEAALVLSMIVHAFDFELEYPDAAVQYVERAIMRPAPFRIKLRAR